MEREIKFRAWDGRYKKMHIPEYTDYSERLIDLEGNQYFERKGIEADTISSGCVDWELMQYTGLKDKHGVDIYEGDIVEFDSYEIGEVCWNQDDDNAEWVIKQIVKKTVHIRQIGWAEKVIGNIHENPELC